MGAADGVQLILALLFLAFLIYLVGRLLLTPLRLMAKIAINSLFGLLLLWAFNFAGSYFSFTIPLNWVTVLVAGFLGIPGLLMLIFFRLVL
ncbi:MAG: pro-sigmaK processing inhibitor BofA family protein [Thermoanaerobacteraceae bacterium]|uniref:pro-sigmaK processing inhibitor BofA family protein n=1 Tax=Thermanaeromonas sp. C210 TaxID=2731925 RepID=UPI00155C6C53|nr:pro-sigmaK processing inhibitor BofA family protein [Thermanaeromonas sp. C210]MBE3580841.1 pro-sigmaK processing inhibitor BofA family protein [Thermoanaerobacteraceae bacterium]GFN21690.1 sigmaK-factor processing regulatory BofA [Thermanaeromonas sp. C210]